MTPKVTETEVKAAIQKILEDKKAYKTSLNYAVNYCQAALGQSGRDLAVQCLYILSNISSWRNTEAKRVRAILKVFDNLIARCRSWTSTNKNLRRCSMREVTIMTEKVVKELSDEQKVEIILYYQQKEVERLEKLRVMGKKYRMNKREKELAMEKELAELRAKVAKAE